MQRLEQYDAYAYPIEEILCDDMFNCRGWFPQESVEELAGDIKVNGLLVPIIIQPWTQPPYRCVAGNRRLAACKLNGETTIAAYLKTGLTEHQAKLLNFTENLQRKDLNMLQEARTLPVLYPKGITVMVAAKELGKGTKWVQARKRLLEMPEAVQLQAAAGNLSELDINERLYGKDLTEQTMLLWKIVDSKKAGRKCSVPRTFKNRKTKEQMNRMLMEMLTHDLNGLYTMTLSWCVGEISDEDLKTEIKRVQRHKIRSRPHGRI